MKTLALSAAALAAMLPIQAMAQSLTSGDWSGYYAGVFTSGLNDGHSTHNNISTGNTTGEFDLDGRTTGLVLGYNLQNDRLVYGGEIDAGWGSIEGSTPVICSLGGCSTDITAIYTARGRLGYAYGPFFPYVTAGVALANVAVDVNDGLGKGDENVFGYVVGLGSEYAVSDQFSLNADLFYMNFNSFEIPVDTYPGSPDTVTDEIETDLMTLRIGANFHF